MQASSEESLNNPDKQGGRAPLSFLRRRWKIVLLVLLMTLAVVFVYTKLQTKIYEATATVEVLSPVVDGSRKQKIIDAVVHLKSRVLAEQVVEQLNLGWHFTEYPDGLNVKIGQFVVTGTLPGLHIKLKSDKSFSVYDSSGRFIAEGVSGESVSSEGVELLLHVYEGQTGQSFTLERQPTAPFVEELLTGLRVAPIDESSNLLKVTMRGSSPEYIRDVVNALIESYQAELVKENSEEIGRIEKQLADVQKRLGEAEEGLREYRQQSGLSELAPQGDLLVAKATQLELRKTNIEWQISQVGFAIQRLQQALKSSSTFVAPRIEGFSQISDAAAQLSQLESTKRALLVDFTEAHPEVEELSEQILKAQSALLALYQNADRELATEMQRLSEKLSTLDAQLNQTPESELVKRTRDRESQIELLEFLQEKERELKVAQLASENEIKVVDPATVPKVPISPNLSQNMAYAGLAGLFLGACCAFLLSVLDPTFKSVEEIRAKLGLPLYGVIPMIPDYDSDAHVPISSLAPKAPVVEAFRALRTRLHYVTKREKHKVILITSSLPGEGKSTLSANLAVVMGMTGAKVLLVGCDLRRPSLHKVFGETNEPGLVELLRDNNQRGIRTLEHLKIDFLSAGEATNNPAEILESKRMRKFINIVREYYDYVVLDVPPVLPVTDAEILAPLSDVNLVLVEPCRVPEKAARQMVKSLQDVGAQIHGVVINDKTGQGFKYYGSYSYYGNRNFAGYYGESLDELQDGPLESAAKTIWRKLNS